MFVEILMGLRDEGLSTASAKMRGGSTLDDFPPDPARGHDEIECPFYSGRSSSTLSFNVKFDVGSRAVGTLHVHYYIIFAGAQRPVVPASGLSRLWSSGLPTGPNMNVLPLVVEGGA